jgi:hypothetical protein
MSRWFPSKTKIQNWIEEQERGFVKAQNNNPNISTEYWLGRYIFIEVHKIFFAGFHQELYEWLARLAVTQFEIISRPLVVWTSTLFKKFKKVYKTV